MINYVAKIMYLSIQSEYRKIQTRKNSVFGYFSRSVNIWQPLEHHKTPCKTISYKANSQYRQSLEHL